MRHRRGRSRSFHFTLISLVLLGNLHQLGLHSNLRLQSFNNRLSCFTFRDKVRIFKLHQQLTRNNCLPLFHINTANHSIQPGSEEHHVRRNHCTAADRVGEMKMHPLNHDNECQKGKDTKEGSTTC
ncbi:MAG: hypothetical protein GKR90_26730 [Pseudomonadales bacterium]|nr:hypothetical protein [Pseudomonadales bacterium]